MSGDRSSDKSNLNNTTNSLLTESLNSSLSSRNTPNLGWSILEKLKTADKVGVGKFFWWHEFFCMDPWMFFLLNVSSNTRVDSVSDY